jgi:serine/threonine protein kinase
MDRAGADPLGPNDPSRIGPYRLVGRIGEGGMGTVYLAEAPTGKPVAVKVVKSEFTVDEGFAVRFHAEVNNARRVASFCTAQVLDNGNADDGRPYMVTEYIAGTPLSLQISRYGALEASTLHGVAVGVAAALAAIHVAGLVHRDLKPANVILSMSGPRVIDFGIARALDATHGVTKSGELLGSPGWWAPEQVRGEEITPAADIFAWGCLIAYAGNGRHPYGRGDMLALASRVLNGRPDLGTLPAPIDRLLRLATDPDPRRRPSAQDLLIALVGGEIPTPTVMEAGPAAPVDPPTLVATEMLNESWEPPANVAAAAVSGIDPDSDDTRPGLSVPGAASLPGAASHPGTPLPGTPVPGGHAPAASFPVTSTPGASLPKASVPEASVPEASVPEASPGASVPGGSVPKVYAPEGSVPGVTVPSASGPAAPGAEVAEPRKSGARAEDNRPSTLTAAPTMPSLVRAPEERPPGRARKWLFPALTVLAGLLVTGGVLTMVLGGRSTVSGTGTASVTTSVSASATHETDVGRRYTAGSYIEDPQFVIPRPARCGLASYQGTTARDGRLCVIEWTLLNTGGDTVPTAATPPTLVDDRGGEHEPVQGSTQAPGTLAPGGRVDGVLVYDLPPARGPATLKVPISGTKMIEVRL